MIDLLQYLENVPGHHFEPLFDWDENLEVKTKLSGAENRRILKRSPRMEEAVIEVVETGLTKLDWDGLFYIMGKGDSLSNFEIMYIGKAERKGVSNPLSANIANIRRNVGKFARWGDGLDYHIGDLSHNLFQFRGYRPPSKKYARWAKVLFGSYDPPILIEPINFYVASWHLGDRGPSGLRVSLPVVEKELIALAAAQFSKTLLNIDGV